MTVSSTFVVAPVSEIARDGQSIRVRAALLRVDRGLNFSLPVLTEPERRDFWLAMSNWANRNLAVIESAECERAGASAAG